MLKISPNVGYVVGVGALVVGAAAYSVGRAGILPDALEPLPTDHPIIQVAKLSYTELAYPVDHNGALGLAGAGAAMFGGLIARIFLQKMKENAAETKRYNTVLTVANGAVIATAAAGFVAGLTVMRNATTQNGLYSPLPQVPSIVLTPREGIALGSTIALISGGLGGAHVASAPNLYRLGRKR